MRFSSTLPSWRALTRRRPILTPKTVLPLFFVIGIIFAPIGGLLLYASSQVRDHFPRRPSTLSGTVLSLTETLLQVQEIRVDYTTCAKDATDKLSPIPDDNVFSAFKDMTHWTAPQWKLTQQNVTYDNVTKPYPLCTVQFSIPEDMKPPVLFYYHLTQFYQNHRRYVNSFLDKQLKGDAVDGATINSSNCKPLTHDLSTDHNPRPIYPCGLIANSMFNDTFSSPRLTNPRVTRDESNSSEAKVYSMNSKTGIAWSSDRALYGPTKYNYTEIVPPPNWAERYPNGYTETNRPPHIEDDEAFMVWMRTAGLPTFSKLYQRNDADTMVAGIYEIDILDSKTSHLTNETPQAC